VEIKAEAKGGREKRRKNLKMKGQWKWRR